MRLCVLFLLVALGPFPAVAQDIAIMPVQIVDSSRPAGDPGQPDMAPIDLMVEVLVSELGATRLPDDAADHCPQNKPGCLLDVVRDSGADQGLFVVVQRSSAQITQVFGNLIAAEDGAVTRATNLNFRSTDDASWQRAGRFMVRQLRRDDR